MKKKRIYLSIKSVISFLLFVILITFFISVTFNAIYVKELNNILVVKENQVLQLSSEVGYFLLESTDTIAMAAYSVNSLQEAGAGDDEILDYLEKQTKVYAKTVSSDFTGIYGIIGGKFYDGSGWVPDENFVAKERPWYQAAVAAKGEVALVTPYLDEKTNTVKMSVCKLLPDRESVLSLDVTLHDIQTLIENSIADGDWYSAMILDSHGIVVAHSDTAELGKDYLNGNGLGSAIATKLYQTEDEYFLLKEAGESYYVFTTEVMDEWYAIRVMEKSVLMEPLIRIWITFFVLLLVLWLGMLYAFLRLNRLKQNEWVLLGEMHSLTDIYDIIWLIRLEQDTYQEADSLTGGLEGSGQWHEKAQYALRAYMDGVTDLRFKKGAYTFIDLPTLPIRLKGRSSVTLDFLDTGNRKCRARFVPFAWDEKGELSSVLWLLEADEERME